MNRKSEPNRVKCLARRTRRKIWWACGAATVVALVALTAPRAFADFDDNTEIPTKPTEHQAETVRRVEIIERPWTGAEYFTQAKAAFRQAQYGNAYRLASHAAIEDAQNPKAHEFRSLSMLAIGDYAGAANEAHLALSLGSPANWATLSGYYGNQQDYVQQLRALEKFSQENPNSADAHFVRAYHYLMTGYFESFRTEMAEAAKLRPDDTLAANLIKLYGEGATAATASSH